MNKNMANSALSSKLWAGNVNLDWLRRLRIGIGVAWGLAWFFMDFLILFEYQSVTSSVVLLGDDY